MNTSPDRGINPDARLQRWQSRTEWPLATVAVIFLGAYSVRVLAQPQGRTETALQLIIWTTWVVFLVDYVARSPRHIFELHTSRPRLTAE